VTAQEYGDRWPYKGFESGEIRCYPKANPLSGTSDLQEVTIVLGGKEYGVNGTALARFPDPRGFMSKTEFDTYEPQTLDGMQDMLRRGLELCRG
jgi:hypothetical protein